MLFLSKHYIMIHLRTVTILALLLSTVTLHGQNSDSPVPQDGDLSLSIRSISFIRNNEYFNPITEGYTLLGFFFRPELVYTPTKKVSLRAGTHLLKYWGTETFSQVRPLLSVSLSLTKNTVLTLGSLPGSDKHRLYDPHFSDERLYNEYAEDGFQVATSREHLFNDMWLSWENFIFKGDSTREIIAFGESFRYTSSQITDFMNFEIPIQLQLKHFGGQISNYTEPVETFFNLAAGLKLNFKIAQERCGKISVEYQQFINREFNGESKSGISSGHASWTRLSYTYKTLSAGASYWKSHDFYAPNGNPIFSSISDYQPDVVISDRKLITNFIYLDIMPESFLGLHLGLDTFYDIDLKRLDNAVSLHISFDKLFRLAMIKN
jgi:hypothetical protein